MPFDGVQYLDPTTTEGRRRLLANALAQQLPGNFRWDYSVIHREKPCGTTGCAIGLAQQMFPEVKELRARFWRPFSNWGKAFGITGRQAHDIFCSSATYGKTCLRDVTASEVAAELEKLDR